MITLVFITLLVDKLLQLKQGKFKWTPTVSLLTELGVHMVVRQGNPSIYQEEVVHVELIQHIANLIARIKMGRGTGVKSDKNFCLYCHTQLSALSVPDRYFHQGKYLNTLLGNLIHMDAYRYCLSQSPGGIRKCLLLEILANVG
jgi:hypothetical protein